MRTMFSAMCVLWVVPAMGQQIATRAQLDALLSDGSFVEDFEGISLAGGTSVSAASPLSSLTQPSWRLLSGVTYTTSGSHFTLYGGSLNGDSSNILEALTGDMTITFNQPQSGVGFDLVNGTGNLTFSETVTFYHNTVPLGTISVSIPPASSTFTGWQNIAWGITSVRIVGNPVEEVDNIEWGRAGNACNPVGDVNGDGQTDGRDIQAFVTCAVTGSGSCTCAHFVGAVIGPADVAAMVSVLLGA